MPRLTVLSAVLIAAAARAELLFSTDLMPGMNGAYYLVQARSLLEKGALAIPDLPLVFSLHALLALVIEVVTPLARQEAVFWAVKLGDSLLPALGVLPVMALAAGWAARTRVNGLLAFLAALLVPASGIALTMVGDFEKNSLGVALLCTLAWALHEWMNHHGRRRALIAVGLLGLVGITHIGVFGSALIFVGCTLGALAVTQGREGLRKVLRMAVFAVPVALVAGGIVFWKFDPERVQKLMGAISEPTEFLSGGMRPPAMGDDGLNWFPFLAFALAVLPGAAVACWRRRGLPQGTVALVVGAAVAVIALTGPWVQGDKMFRLQMNAAPLAVLCLLFALLQIRRDWLRGGVGVAVLGLLLTPSVFRVQAGGHPIITEEAQAELKELAACVEEPAQTLVVARHGLEWWTAWTLHTHIAQAQALTPEDWQRYKYVWFLEEKRGGMGMNMGPPGMMMGGPPGQGGGRGRPEEDSWLGTVLRLLTSGGRGQGGGPPGMTMRPGGGAGGPPNGGPPGMSGPGMNGPGGRGGRPGGGGMMGVAMPDNASLLHEGEHYRLGWVAEVPEFVLHPRPEGKRR